MLDGEKFKEILYLVIDSIGRKRIQLDLALNIDSSQRYIDILIDKFFGKIIYELNEDYDDTTIGILCEALLHFMLTICTIPSGRKIRTKNDLTVDIIIPNLRTLWTNPDKSIIIQIIKDEMIDLDEISELEYLQPNYKNIRLVNADSILTAKYKVYSLLPDLELKGYSNIVVDINNFLKETGDKSFRFVH